ncbi:MAG: glycerol kinase GlpK [Clostridia bacterium]|nr:glycerol kinase GlpK [Clostridia bacterium]
MSDYIIAIDQSTQSTKVLLFDGAGRIRLRVDRPHRQIIDEKGWVEHDPEEIWQNLMALIPELLCRSGVSPDEICAAAITNQRETSLAWERATGRPVANAVVWQCARGAAICDALNAHAEAIRQKTGLQLSPYFSAAKLAWILRNVPHAAERAEKGDILLGTMDSYLVYRLTGGQSFRTDLSNASRTQLFNLASLAWDEDILRLFGIPSCCMAEVSASDELYGYTDFRGTLPKKIPIHSVMGDSHAALFAQGCLEKGMIKVGYGTGSSIMMNIGETPVLSSKGVVTSIAWKLKGHVNYILEGNVNYSGAIVTWLKDQAGLLQSSAESEELARRANPQDKTCLVPAFSGLGAPYWRSDVSAAFIGMSRTTGKAELVKAGLEAIALQITDIVNIMREETGIRDIELRVDGGPSRNKWLMQFQSDMLDCPVLVPETEELSCVGAAYAAGMALGLYGEAIFTNNRYLRYKPEMEKAFRLEKAALWQAALNKIL